MDFPHLQPGRNRDVSQVPISSLLGDVQPTFNGRDYYAVTGASDPSVGYSPVKRHHEGAIGQLNLGIAAAAEAYSQNIGALNSRGIKTHDLGQDRAAWTSYWLVPLQVTHQDSWYEVRATKF